MKAVSARVSKMGEAKKAMPFVQALKRKVDSSNTTVTGTTADNSESKNHATGSKPKSTTAAKEVFDRTLPFDEHEILTAMAPGLKQTLQKCHTVEIILVDNKDNDSGNSVAAKGTPSSQAANGNPDGDSASADGITGILVAGDGRLSASSTADEEGKESKRRAHLPPVALSAEPGAPTFYFENV